MRPFSYPFPPSHGVRCSSLTVCEKAGGRREVGQPINKILQGVFDVLTFEAVRSHSPAQQHPRIRVMLIFADPLALTEAQTALDRLARGRPAADLCEIATFQEEPSDQARRRQAVRIAISFLLHQAYTKAQKAFTSPKLYFVKVDVRAAYDTIQQDKLLQIVEAVLQEVRLLRSTGHE